MFLKRVVIEKDGKSHTYWALTQSVRTARGPRHRTVAYLGELVPAERQGWVELRRVLDRTPPTSGWLFGDPHAVTEPVPVRVEVEVRGVHVGEIRDFGDVYIGWLLWRTLQLDTLLAAQIPAGREAVAWPVVAAILALARFCEPSSELHIADTWFRRTALGALLGVPPDAVNTDRLYRGLDALLPHKAAIERHLKDRFATMFDATYDLILYDVTSTYFEGAMPKNPQAQRGHSRDKRFDCKQVCIALLVTREGLPFGYEVFAGNRNDVTTLEEIVETVERKHGAANRLWVVDRGIASEDNLAFLRARSATYVVGTPKDQLKPFERHLVDQADWTTVEPGVEVKLLPGPEGTETFVLCRSRERREKERAIHERFARRIEAGLTTLATRLRRARKDQERAKVERQIGRLLERNSRAAGLFAIQVEDAPVGERPGLRVTWTKRAAWAAWAAASEGHYLLRTNLVGWTPHDLWKTYIQLTQAEAAFRTYKSELAVRPIWHQLQHRAQAHILFSFLAYALWKTLEQWMARSGLGDAPRPVLEELARLKLVEVRLPTSTGRVLSLWCVSQPDQGQRILLARLGIELPQRLGEPRWVQTVERNVV
ncbi:MAG: IS1634 family transposase [Nitrospirae bacterium]|nr:IS1634 family transposase [Nitrospirota bacterium]